MKIEIKRWLIGEKSTIGSMFIDGVFKCYTLEDVVRPKGAPKVWGQTAIPSGTYPVVVNVSPRFHKLYPRILNVPGFTGILIHAGNTAENTDGCILVGLGVDSADRISRATEAFRGEGGVFDTIRGAYGRGEKVEITITNDWDDAPFGSLAEWSGVN